MTSGCILEITLLKNSEYCFEKSKSCRPVERAGSDCKGWFRHRNWWIAGTIHSAVSYLNVDAKSHRYHEVHNDPETRNSVEWWRPYPLWDFQPFEQLNAPTWLSPLPVTGRELQELLTCYGTHCTGALKSSEVSHKVTYSPQLQMLLEGMSKSLQESANELLGRATMTNGCGSSLVNPMLQKVHTFLRPVLKILHVQSSLKTMWLDSLQRVGPHQFVWLLQESNIPFESWPSPSWQKQHQKTTWNGYLWQGLIGYECWWNYVFWLLQEVYFLGWDRKQWHWLLWLEVDWVYMIDPVWYWLLQTEGCLSVRESSEVHLWKLDMWVFVGVLLVHECWVCLECIVVD